MSPSKYESFVFLSIKFSVHRYTNSKPIILGSHKILKVFEGFTPTKTTPTKQLQIDKGLEDDQNMDD